MPPERWMVSVPPTPLLGRTLRRLRLSRGLSQDAIEEALGIDQSVLSAYERDARVPGRSTLRRLAEFYDQPREYLVVIASEDRDRREAAADSEPVPGESVAIPAEPELLDAVRALFLLETDELPDATKTITLLAEKPPGREQRAAG